MRLISLSLLGNLFVLLREMAWCGVRSIAYGPTSVLAVPNALEKTQLKGFFRIGRFAQTTPKLASTKVQQPRAMKLYVMSCCFSKEFCTAVVRMIPAIKILQPVSDQTVLNSHWAIKEDHLQASKKENTAKHDSLAQLQIQSKNLWDWKCENHRIRQDVTDGIRDPESFRIDTRGEDRLVPRARNRDALQNRRSDCTNVPADDNTHACPAGVLEGFPDEYALAE